jgi:type IV pilus assembly protein PilX
MNNKQTGSILLLSLLMLLILSMVGAASIGNVTVNERMASNYRDHDMTFQAAEAALAEGENRASSYSVTFSETDFQTDFTASCNNGFCFNGNYPVGGVCDEVKPASPLWLDDTTWTTAGAAREAIIGFPTLPVQPKYIIEFMCYVVADTTAGTPSTTPPYGGDWAHMYRITAYAEGATGGSRTMLQSTFKVL